MLKTAFVSFFPRLRDDENFRNRVCFPSWAILAALSYPTIGLPLIWVAYIPLIYALHRTSLQKIALYLFFSSLFYYVATLYWLVAFHESSAFFVFPYSAFTFTVFMLFARYAAQRFPFFRFIAVPLFLAAFEVFRSVGFLGFRWNTVADALWNQILFLQIADIVGWVGVSFLVVLVNSVAAEILILWDRCSFRDALFRGLFPFYMGCFCFFGDVAYGAASLQRWTKIVDKDLSRARVALIQPNRPGAYQWKEAEPELYAKFESMVQTATEQKADLIVQTEIMTLDYLWQNLNYLGKGHPENKYSSQLVELPKKYDTPMVLTHFDVDPATGFLYNAATYTAYDSAGLIQTNTYRKIHLVPFGEWIPGAKSIPWVKNALEKLGAAWATPGTEFTVIKPQKGMPFAILICFEDIYAMLARIFSDQGASFFVNPTNDGWAYKWKLGARAPLWQHLASAVHTSISLRRSIARSVNTGISAVIDPLGRIEYSGIPEYTDGVYVASVPVMPPGYRTQYARGGWFLEYVFFVLAALFLFRALVGDHRSKDFKKILS